MEGEDVMRRGTARRGCRAGKQAEMAWANGQICSAVQGLFIQRTRSERNCEGKEKESLTMTDSDVQGRLNYKGGQLSALASFVHGMSRR